MISLLEYKVSKYDDIKLFNTTIEHLRVLESSTKDKIYLARLKALLAESLRRNSLSYYAKDFAIALKLLNYL